MHSFLVSTPPDVPAGPDVLAIIPETSIGIEDVRRIQTFLSRKPLKSVANIVIVHQAEKLSLPAQHAILKTLEEPPGNSQIYLVSDFPDQLLPTILSRVQVQLTIPNSRPNPASLTESWDLLTKLLSSDRVGERAQILDTAKFSRETFLAFLNHLEHLAHHHIRNSQFSEFNYQLIVDSRRYLKANVNLSLVLTEFAARLRSSLTP